MGRAPGCQHGGVKPGDTGLAVRVGGGAGGCGCSPSWSRLAGHRHSPCGTPHVAPQPCSPGSETAEPVTPLYVVATKESVPDGQQCTRACTAPECNDTLLCFSLCGSGRELGQDRARSGDCNSCRISHTNHFGGAISPCSKVIFFPSEVLKLLALLHQVFCLGDSSGSCPCLGGNDQSPTQ